MRDATAHATSCKRESHTETGKRIEWINRKDESHTQAVTEDYEGQTYKN